MKFQEILNPVLVVARTVDLFEFLAAILKKGLFAKTFNNALFACNWLQDQVLGLLGVAR